MKEQTLKFAIERTTKNMVRYNEVNSNPSERPIVGSLYVSQKALGSEPYPELITVLIKAAS